MPSAPDRPELEALIAYIETRTATTKQNAVSALSRLLFAAYLAGAARAGKTVGEVEPLGMAGLEAVTRDLGPVLDETFGILSSDLTAVVRAGIRNNHTYANVRDQLARKIRDGWGSEITFDRVGQVRRYVDVAPDGTMQWAEKEITRSVTLPTRTYADTLARTNMKRAFDQGHHDRYRASGSPGWVYLSVNDERSRPHHVALHGRVFRYGTAESDMAMAVMSEPHCRCRPKAWFDNPSHDTAPDVYDRQRAAWQTDSNIPF